MTIAPIFRTVTTTAPPAQAFALFSGQMGRWWPVGRTVGKSPHVDVVIEPAAEGRWYERDVDGVETQWGKVLAWEPPSRLLLGWQLNSRFVYDPNLMTEVEVTFEVAGQGTRVTLEHRNLERFGADAEAVAAQLGGGWPGMLGAFVDFSNLHPTSKE